MDTINLTCKTRKEIASELGITERTFYRWLKKAGIKLPRGRIAPYHIEIIYRTYSSPEQIKTV